MEKLRYGLVGCGRIAPNHIAAALSAEDELAVTALCDRDISAARALAKKPRLLLCDEPTGALDYQTGKQILALLQRQSRENGMTVVIITHNSALTAMADRVIRVKSGQITGVRCSEAPVPVESIEW